MPQLPSSADLTRFAAFSPDRLWARYGDWAMDRLVQTALALAILGLGFWLARRIGHVITRAAAKGPRLDATIISVLSSSARYVVLFFAMVLALQQLGVETASIVTVLGAATLAIGLALQGTLSNVAAGMVILLLRPYRLGDVIEMGGKEGIVRGLTLFTTELASFDNVRLIIPNSLVLSGRIANFSTHPQRRVDLEFRIGLDQDFDRAIEVLRAEAARDPRVLADPPLSVELNGHNEFGVLIAVWAWCKSAEWPALKAELTKAMLRRLRAEGLRPAIPTYRWGAEQNAKQDSL